MVPARDAAMDGAVVYACDPDTTAANWLFPRGLPLVTVDQEPLPDVPSVNVDDRGGGRQAATHLVGLGHRRIGILAFGNGPEGLVHDPTPDAVAGRYIARERLAGYLDVARTGRRPAGRAHVSAQQRRGGVPAAWPCWPARRPTGRRRCCASPTCSPSAWCMPPSSSA